jgi:hypothetical protein
MYEVEIRITEDDFAPDEVFVTLKEAIEHIERICRTHLCPTAWINNKKVRVQNGTVIGQDGNRLSTDQAWHIKASGHPDQILEASTKTLNSAMVQLARARHARQMEA